MASPTHKPLPNIPRRRSDFQRISTYLTVEGREHLRTLIRSALSEEDNLFHEEGERESWAIALECALDELGKNIINGGWLTGVKRSRMAGKARRAEELRKLEEEKTKKRVEDAASLKGKGKVEVSEDAGGQSVEKDLPKAPSRHSSASTDHSSQALQQLRELAARPTAPMPKPTAKHLLLCLMAMGKAPSVEDSGFDIVPHTTGCTFTPELFSLPETLSDDVDNGVLFGLHEWDVKAYPSENGLLTIVGGTFAFKGVSSLAEQHALSKALQISIYIYLSLTLEQHFLTDSNVAVKLSRPRVIITNQDLPPIRPVMKSAPPSDLRQRPRNSLLPISVVSYLSKKTEGFFHRTSGVAPSFARHGSLDVKSGAGPFFPRSSTRASQEHSLGRLRRLSFMPESRLAILPQPQPETLKRPDRPFTATLDRLRQSRNLLSSSPGVLLEPPMLLVALADKEEADPTRRLRADEKTGLKSILGWDGRRSQGKGMTGTLGFVRQQEFSVLHSRHVPSILSTIPPAEPFLQPTRSMTISNPSPPIYTTCDKARWITYQYYSRDSASDKTLGDAVVDLCSAADSPCDKSECQFKRGQHELRFIHGGLRIVLKVEPRKIEEGASAAQSDVIEMWESCKNCGATSKRNPMSDGTYLFSFAKFLELLCYSPAICTLTPALCEHTTPPTGPKSSTPRLPDSRLDIIRHFSQQSYTVSFQLSSIENIFELRVPRLQLMRMNGTEKSSFSPGDARILAAAADAEKTTLRREIKSWWQGVSDHIDKLEEIISQERPPSFSKSLPRLPSADEAYDEGDTPNETTPKIHISELPPQSASVPTTPLLGSDSELPSDSVSAGATTPKAKSLALPPLPPSAPGSPSHTSSKLEDDGPSYFTVVPPPPPEKVSGDVDLLHRLQNLRHSFQQTEQSLYASLTRTPVSSLNEVRTAFLTGARGATRRLAAWQKKHLPKAAKGQLITGKLSIQEPEWWKKSCHALPGNIIVREGDWGSIIAFTLGSLDYQRELASMSIARTASSVPALPSPSPSLTAAANQSSFFGGNATFTLFSPPAKPDPDQEGIVWHEAESYSAVIGRKEHPRDQTSILSIREVLRNKNIVEGESGLPSRFTNTEGSKVRSLSGTVPLAAWAKPAVEINRHAVGGEVSPSSTSESAGKLLQQVEAISSESSNVSTLSSSEVSKSQFGDAHIRRGRASSLRSSDSGSTIGADNDENAEVPELPPKDSAPSTPVTHTNSYFTTTVTNAMRYMLSVGESPRLPPPSFRNQHKLLLADPFVIDERPHIKYDWMIGKRLKFSCTVYYAKQFDGLRRRCGIEDVFLKSLGQSTNWAAEGGKSKSNFWKTHDDRFIIKTLVNAWNVADLSVLIDLAPSYFRYMETTSGEPTVLAKLLGFYTVEIKNLETGNTQSKADLLLMENLFFDQTVGKTFDLKGIQGRKVKTGSSGNGPLPPNKTLFDGEWIEGQQRTLVRPHSKLVLQEAIRNDCDFLARSNIMDYSLLLGLDEGKKQIACGLVDTIGSYTFAKTLEYKAKQGLNAGKEVTVIPPIEYQDRFVKALDGYFLACPDKWSKPLESSKVLDGVHSLPCVL